MHEAAPTGKKCWGIRRWRRWLGAICAVPLLGFVLSNLWLTSPWGRGWMVAKIRHRSGLQTEIRAASWSPWNGFTLRDIQVLQPPELRPTIREPLLHIASLRLTPHWLAGLHGRLDVRSVALESPRLVLSVQMMSYLAQQPATPAAPSAVPPIATLIPPPASPAPLTPATPAQTAVPPQPAQTPAAPENAPSPQPSIQSSPQPPPPEPPRPTQRLHLRHASFALISSTGPPPLLEVNELNGDLPVAGNAAHSSLQLTSLYAHGKPLLTGLHASLTWQAPVLSLNPVATTVEGIQLAFAGKLAFIFGLPMQLELQVPKQAPPPLALPGGGELTAAQIAIFGRFRGLLLAPGTWQGDFLTEASSLTLTLGGHQTAFDTGSCATLLRGGVLSCVDARCVGDELSLLGNATVLADGRAAGVLRLIAAPETTIGIVKRLFPASDPAANLTPLSSPQRAAFDLEAFGDIQDLQLRLGQNGPVTTLK